MQNFTTLFQDLLSNLGAILSTPIPTTPFNYSNDLRIFESNVLKFTDELMLAKYKDRRESMSILGEDKDEVQEYKEDNGITPYNFATVLKQLNELAHELDSYKWACGDFLEDPKNPRDFEGDRQKLESLFKILERATVKGL